MCPFTVQRVADGLSAITTGLCVCLYRWAVSTAPGITGIGGPYIDVMCIDAGLQRPSYQLRNGSWRGFVSPPGTQHPRHPRHRRGRHFGPMPVLGALPPAQGCLPSCRTRVRCAAVRAVADTFDRARARTCSRVHVCVRQWMKSWPNNNPANCTWVHAFLSSPPPPPLPLHPTPGVLPPQHAAHPSVRRTKSTLQRRSPICDARPRPLCAGGPATINAW